MSRVLLACLGLGVMVACGQSPQPTKTDFAQPTTIEGTIADYVDRPDKPARVEFRSKNSTLLGFANATQAGTFSLNLPSAADVTSKLEETDLLLFFAITAIGNEDCTGEIKLSPVVPVYSLLKLGFTQGDFATDRDISSGTISVVNGFADIDQDFWIYASSPTQLTGIRNCNAFQTNANLFLKKGWNTGNFKWLSSKNRLEIQSVEPSTTTWRSNANFK